MTGAKYDEALARLRGATRHQRGLESGEDVRDAMNAFFRSAADAPDTAALAATDVLVNCDFPTGAGYLAVWLGAAVEDGQDPELTCGPIVETFLRWALTVETSPEVEAGENDEADYPEDPEPDEETISGLQLLGQALVAHLARAPNHRRRLAETGEIRRQFERIEHLSYGATWVMHLLRQCSGEIIVLNAAHRKGVIVRYKNISNCFHLFTLLQGAVANIMPDAQQTPEDVLAVARGEASGEVHDHAWWHYGQGDCPKADMGASIWGEAEPDRIVQVDGAQVMLLWPPILQSRSWDAGFFSPILHASLPGVEVVRELSAPELGAWWARLGLPITAGEKNGNEQA